MTSMEVQFGPTTNSMVDSPAATAEARYHSHYDPHRHHPNHNHPYLLQQQAPIPQNSYHGYTSPLPRSRKRKADPGDNNERLSKRLGLLNLEKNGHKLYMPVETPSSQSPPERPGYNNSIQSSSPVPATDAGDSMQLDNTKHKVYIYDLDAELSSADETSDAESFPGSPTSGRDRLVFLPDIEKHLFRSRIPSGVFANSEGELAGHNINDMQMVLYSEPSSLTVPREQDSVRKAILEARARARQKQRDNQAETDGHSMPTPIPPSPVTDQQNPGHANGVNVTTMNGFGVCSATDPPQSATPWHNTLVVDDDVDAMDMD